MPPGRAPQPRQEEEGCLCRSRSRSCSARQGEGTQHQSPLCAGSHKVPLWRRQQPNMENRAFRLGRAGGRSHGVRRHAALAQGPEQHPATARAEPSSPHPAPSSARSSDHARSRHSISPGSEPVGSPCPATTAPHGSAAPGPAPGAASPWAGGTGCTSGTDTVQQQSVCTLR